MSTELLIAAVLFLASMAAVAFLRGVRAALITSLLLLAVGVGYVVLVGAFRDVGKWLLVALILLAGAGATLWRRRRP